MSRAININLPAAAVVAMCVKHKSEVSCIEALPDGATRVVMVNSDGAAAIRSACARKLMPERTRRFPQWSADRIVNRLG